VQIGSMKHRLKFQSQVKTPDAMGGTTVSWKDESVCWGSIWPVGGSEARRSGQLTFEITHNIRIRYRSDIDASYRISHRGAYYSIVSIINPNLSNKILDILCKETET